MDQSVKRLQPTPALLAVFLLTLLFLLAPLLPGSKALQASENYLPLHTGMELFAILVAFLVFTVGWTGGGRDRPRNFVVLSCGFLGVALLDFGHLLSYPGMPIFVTPSTTEKAINFWLSARYSSALTLLAFVFIPWRQVVSQNTPKIILAFVLGVTGIFYYLVLFSPGVLPRTFIPGEGLTHFKIGAEYFLALMYAMAAMRLYAINKEYPEKHLIWLAVGAWLMGLSELFFTLYSTVTDTYNLMGHIYKVAAYMAIYKAVFVESVRAPFAKLEEHQTALRRSQAQLESINERLESLVEERSNRLSETTKMLQTVLDTVPLRIFWKDRNFNYLGCNQLLAIDAGKSSPQELVGRSDYDMPWKETAELYRQDDARVIASGISKLGFEEPMDMPGGERIWLSTNKVPLRDAGGNIIGVMGTFEDITQRKNTEQALVEAKIEAERANRAKSEFLSRMSHELRTPLNAILGFGQLMELEGGLKPDQSEQVHEIVHAGEHLLEMINEILDLSRIEAGRIDLSMESVELVPLVDECVAMIKPLANKHRIVIEKESGGIVDGKVRADRTRLNQILINLLSNAVKYNHEAGRIYIGCRRTADDRIRVSVRDTGLGIDAGSMGKLFRPFERLESPYSGIEGTGIGLALTKRLAEAMNGTIGVESEVSKGSTFWVELPIA